MAVATKSANKSGFVKDFLRNHPEGNVKAVNEAWTAAGMKGTIGDTLIYQTRADMGLSGKRGRSPSPGPQPRQSYPPGIPGQQAVRASPCSSRSI